MFSSLILVTYSLTHSLIHCCAWPARTVATSQRAILRRWPKRVDCAPVVLLHHLYDPLFLWPARWTLPVGAGHLPCERLTQCSSMLWAGTSGGRRQTCPSNESLLSAMMRGRSVSFVWFRTESLVTKSYHFMFRMRRTARTYWRDARYLLNNKLTNYRLYLRKLRNAVLLRFHVISVTLWNTKTTACSSKRTACLK